jgi:hypothetical protein
MINATAAGGYMGARPPLFSLDRIKGALSNATETAKEGAKTIFASQVAAEGWRDVFAGVKGGVGSVADAAAGASAATAASATATGAASTGLQAVKLAPVGRNVAGQFIHLDVAKMAEVGRDASGRFVSLKGAASGASLPTVGAATELAAEVPKTGLSGWFQRLFGGGKPATPPAPPTTVPTSPVIPPAPGAATPFAGPTKVNVSLEFAGPAQAREVTTLKIIREPLKVNGVKVPAGGGSTAGAVADDVVGATGANGATGSAGAAGQGGTLIKSGLSKVLDGMKAGAKNGALFSGVISAAINGFKVLTGQERFSTAAGSVAADTASGAVSGATGAAVSGLALAAAGAFGLTAGLPLTLIGIGGGLLGAIVGDKIFKGTGIYDGIKGLVSKIFGG